MRFTAGELRLSATDLANHLGCRHLTALDLAAARGEIQPTRWEDPRLEALRQRGFEHEERYLEQLAAEGRSVVRIDGGFDQTVAAMRGGADVIVQATLADGRWHGRADVLLRVDRSSALGDWSYEVVDTKLARDTRAGTILQLCLYTELLRAVQGELPERMHVVTPVAAETFRVLDYLAYFRRVRASLEEAVAAEPATYPEPVDQCDYCRWWPDCDKRRRADDHLSLVAGLGRSQTVELRARDVDTLAGLAALPLPLPFKPSRGSVETFTRLREQARVQLEARTRGEPVYELLPHVDGQGLARLPEPSPADVFFDIEGDPFAGDGGLEYLFGWVDVDGAYQERWATNPAEERAVFEAFLDDMAQRPAGFHIYHFAPYEPAALKRLMGRHATRETELDELLRSERFVDLHAVVRQSIRAGVERYSLKDLEPLYGFDRALDLRAARTHLREIEHALELGGTIADTTREAVAAYNRDDCVSLIELRDWLESLRGGIARPEPKSGEASEERTEQQERVRALAARLVAGGHDLMAHLLDWHRREENSAWWEYFRLRDLTDDGLVDEKRAVAGLTYEARVGGTDRSPVQRYCYAEQETTIRAGDDLYTTDETKHGTVELVDPSARTIDIKKPEAVKDTHPTALFAHKLIRAGTVAEALFRLGERIADGTADGAAFDLLTRVPPRADLARGESAVEIARTLDGGVLPIQGPPGSGKTYNGARMIKALVHAGKTVAVTAVSHKVIRHLLDEVLKADRHIRCIQRVTRKPKEGPVEETKDNARVLAALHAGEAQVAGGTAWVWSRPEFAGAVDVLFVDEAGQMALANVLAVAQAARSVVLLGDPQQLEQPQRGCHPEGADVSALDHLLQGRPTIPPDRGVFLEDTWRLHPSICTFTSEVFYESRLRSRPDLANQDVRDCTVIPEPGLWFAPVEHAGNQSRSDEEADRVEQLVAALTDGARWIDKEGRAAPLTHDDILISRRTTRTSARSRNASPARARARSTSSRASRRRS